MKRTLRAIAHAVYVETRSRYLNVPDYVFNELYKGSDEKFFSQLNRLNWKLTTIDVNLTDFAQCTQDEMIAREFGDANPANVPNDFKRTVYQRTLVSRSQPGENEPIVVVKAVDGYRLWEGWHRTMALLRTGSNEGPPSAWRKVLIKAWIGYR